MLAQRLLALDGIPWLPTDVIRTVVRRVAPEVDAVDQDPVDAVALAEVMYPHIEQAAEVCAEEADRFLIEGFELAPSYPVRLQAALGETEIRPCFLGHGSFSAEDLAGYRGPKPQSESDLSPCACRTWTSGRLTSRPRWPQPGACFLVVADAPMAFELQCLVVPNYGQCWHF